MSKGSRRRASLVDEATLATNWARVFGGKKEEKSNLIEIYVWPNGVWCEPDELETMNHMSDDYTLAHLTEREYMCLVGDIQALL